MDASVVSSLIAGVGVIMTAWLGFMGNKKGTLASAESEFRTTILKENESLRERIEKLENKFSLVLIENVELKAEITRLKADNNSPNTNTDEVIEDEED